MSSFHSRNMFILQEKHIYYAADTHLLCSNIPRTWLDKIKRYCHQICPVHGSEGKWEQSCRKSKSTEEFLWMKSENEIFFIPLLIQMDMYHVEPTFLRTRTEIAGEDRLCPTSTCSCTHIKHTLITHCRILCVCVWIRRLLANYLHVPQTQHNSSNVPPS